MPSVVNEDKKVWADETREANRDRRKKAESEMKETMQEAGRREGKTREGAET
jgi:DNA-binding protein YbaB